MANEIALRDNNRVPSSLGENPSGETKRFQTDIQGNQKVNAAADDTQYQDDSATPKKSPLTVSSTEVVIKVPSNALAFVYQSRGAAIQLTTTSGFGSGYITVLSGNGDTLECNGTANIYVKRDAAVDATLHFYFKTT